MRWLVLVAMVACGGDDASPMLRLEINLGASLISPLEITTVAARLVDADGRPASGAAVTVASSDPAVATVDAGGKITGVAAGTATITATSGTLSASSTLAVRAGPPARFAHAMAYDEARRQVVMFGGGTQTVFHADTWVWEGAGWRKLDVSGPSGRIDHAMVYDPGRARVILVGGTSEAVTMGTDVWEWDGTRWEARPATGDARLPPRRHFSAGFDRARQRLVVHGGFDAAGPLDDTWEWDGTRWERRATSGPARRILPSRWMVWSPARGRLLMLIGDDAASACDVWAWDGSAWSVVDGGRVRIDAPVPISETGTAGEVLALAEGAQGGALAVTQRFDGAAWTVVGSPEGPPRRFVSAMAYDAARGQVVLFGGSGPENPPTGRYFGDTWLWDGTRWSRSD